MKRGNGVVYLIGQISPVQAIILRELIVDGRKSINEIAKENGLNKQNVQNNFEELEKSGVIKGATIHINYSFFGYKAVGHLLVSGEPTHAENLLAYTLKLPDIYFAYLRGPKGNMDVTITLKTLRELETTKNLIRKQFAVGEIKTAIWTNVKEMNQNLSILTQNSATPSKLASHRKSKEIPTLKKCIIDQTDLKMADKLAENGRAPMEEIAKEIGISTDTAQRKFNSLKKKGVIKVTIQFDPTKIGYKALGIFFAVTSNINPTSIIDKISQIPDIISVMETSGAYDLQIYAMIKEIDQLLVIQEELGKIEGITKIDPEILRVPDKWPSPRQYISTF